MIFCSFFTICVVVLKMKVNCSYFCFSGTKSADEFPCPAGSYTNKTGNVRIEDCESCIGGSYCEEGSSDPTPCEPYVFFKIGKPEIMIWC